MVIYNVHPTNPQKRYLDSSVRILRDEGGIAVYPTDTVYGMGASILNPKGIDKIGHILDKNKDLSYSFICSNFAQVAKYARLSNAHFKLLKRYLPGAFTFILPATNYVPKKINPKRKTVGIRIPDCNVILQLVELLGEPIANTSIGIAGDLRGDPEEVRAAVLNSVDLMLDIGPLENATASTIVDLTSDEPVVVREGKGVWKE